MTILHHSYPVPAAETRTTLRVANSRFIASAACTPTVEAAKNFIAEVRATFPDASHHAYAYLIGHGASVVAGMSDAGEPAGTAGHPMLSVLRGSGLGDVTVVVTRYFGGTLLGTGGLVRAYRDATRAVLEALPRAEHVDQRRCVVRFDYSQYMAVLRLLKTYQGTVTHEDFAARVTLTIVLPVHQLEPCMAALADVTTGQAEITVDVAEL